MEESEFIYDFGGTLLDERYFDCECRERYIHLKSKTPTCPCCNKYHGEMPDSRTNEIEMERKSGRVDE
jgi:hypothetical protein